MTSFINGNREEIIKNSETVAYYPVDQLKALKSRFKEICTHPDFESYEDLDDFINRIYFLEFLYFYIINLYTPENLEFVFVNPSNMKQFLNIQKSVHNFIRHIFRIDHNSTKNENKNESRIKMTTTMLFTMNSTLQYLKRTIDIDPEKIALTSICKGFIYFLEKYKSNTFRELYKNDWSIRKFISLMNSSIITNNEVYFDLINRLQTEKTDKLKLYLIFQKKFRAEIAKLRIKIGSKLTKHHSDFGSHDMFEKYVFPKIEGNFIYDFLKLYILESNVKNIKKNTLNVVHDIQSQRNLLKNIQQRIKNNPLAISSNIKNKVLEIKNTIASYNSSNSNEAKNEARKEITKIFRKLATISKRIDRSLEIYTTEFPKIGTKQKQTNKKQRA